MLRYPYFYRTYNRLFSHFVDSGASNLDVCPHTIHTAVALHTESKALEGTALCGPQKVYSSEEKELEAMAKLHIPVMVDQVVHCLAPQKGQVFLDMTFGSGGHTRAILQKEPDVMVYALDRDPVAYAIAEQLSRLYPTQIQALLGQFSQAEALLMKAGVQPGTIDGILMDLGCSSMQLDAPERGFSLRKDGPLDMRMDGDRFSLKSSIILSSILGTIGVPSGGQNIIFMFGAYVLNAPLVIKPSATPISANDSYILVLKERNCLACVCKCLQDDCNPCMKISSFSWKTCASRTVSLEFLLCEFSNSLHYFDTSFSSEDSNACLLEKLKTIN